MALQGALQQAVASIGGNKGATTSAPKAPVPQVTPPTPSGLGVLKNDVGNFVNSDIVSPVKDTLNTAASQLQQGASGKGSVAGRTGDIMQGIATGAGAYISPIMKIITDAFSNANIAGVDVNKVKENLINNPDFQKFAMSPAGQTTAKVADVTGKVANVAGLVVGGAAGAEDLISPKITPAETIAPPETSADIIKNPITPEEQQIAFKQGRIAMDNGKPTVTPTKTEVNMQNELNKLPGLSNEKDPLTGNIKPEVQLNNGLIVQNEIKNTSTQLRSFFKNIDAQDIANGDVVLDKNGFASKGIWNNAELSRNIWDVEDPVSIKSTDTLTQNLNDSVYRLIQDTPKTTEGLLDLRQNFDAMVRKDYPNLYEGDMTPTRIKIQNMREVINKFTEDQIPEGAKLPDGSSFRDALSKQHNLLNANEEMAQKFSREYFTNGKPNSRFESVMKAHPSIKMWVKRLGYGLVVGSVLGGSIYGVGKTINKGIQKAISGK